MKERVGIAFAASAVLLGGAVAHGASAARGALPHGASTAAAGALHPGSPAADEPRGAPLARSFSHPLRVVGRAEDAPAAVRLLVDAERAYDAVTLGLGMPAPDVDPRTGLLTVSLDADLREPLRVNLVREPVSAYDRAFAEVHLAADWGRAPGCARDRTLARGMARASLARLSPAIVERDARALSEALANLATPCAAPAPPPPTTLSLARDATGTAAFWDDLDATYGADPGQLLLATADLSATRTTGHLPPRRDDPWLPSPDVYTVLRASFADALTKGSTFDDVLLDLAVRRVFARQGADVAVDWRIEWPDTPRRLALTPLEACGTSYTVIQLPGAPPAHLQLRLEASWEQHATMRFALLALAPDGHLLRRLDPPAIFHATSTNTTLVDLEGAAAVVIVVTNTGDPDVSLSLPLDDTRSPEPHVALLTLASQTTAATP